MKLRKLKSRKPWHQLVIEEGTEAQFMACFKRLRFHRCYRCGMPNLIRYKGPVKVQCSDQQDCLARARARREESLHALDFIRTWR